MNEPMTKAQEIKSLKKFINAAPSKAEDRYQEFLKQEAVYEAEVKQKFARLMELTGGARK